MGFDFIEGHSAIACRAGQNKTELSHSVDELRHLQQI